MNTNYQIINSGNDINILSPINGDPCEVSVCTDCIGVANMPSIISIDPQPDTSFLQHIDPTMFSSNFIPPGSPDNYFNCASGNRMMNVVLNFNEKLGAQYLSSITSTGINILLATKAINGCGNWGRYRVFAIKKRDTMLQYRGSGIYDFEKLLLSYGDYYSVNNNPLNQQLNVKNVFKKVGSKILFSVDVGNLIDLNIFDPLNDFITVAGSFQEDPFIYTLSQVTGKTIYTGQFLISGGNLSRLEYYYNKVDGNTLDVTQEYSYTFNKNIKRTFLLQEPSLKLPTVCFDNQCSGYSYSTSYAFRDWREIRLDASSHFSIYAPETGLLQVWGQATDPISEQNVINAGVTNVPNDAKELSFVNAGSLNIFGVNKSGKGFAWGDNSKCLNNIPNNLGPVVKIVGCDYAAIALKENLKITGWGCGTEYANWDGWTGIINQLKDTDIVDIEAGKGFLLALTNNGNVISWGINSSSGEFTKCIEKMPGSYTILNSGGFSGYYLGVSGLRNIKRIVGGREFVVGISGDRYELFGWGSGSKTDFGSGPKYYYQSGIKMPSLQGIKYISAGDFNAQAIDSKDNLYIWGTSGTNPSQNELAYGQYLIKWGRNDGLFKDDAYACAAGLKHSLALRYTYSGVSSDENGCELVRWGQGVGIDVSDSITGIYNTKKLSYCFNRKPLKFVYINENSIYLSRDTCTQNVNISDPQSCSYTGKYCSNRIIIRPEYFQFFEGNIWCGTTDLDIQGSLLVSIQGSGINEVRKLQPSINMFNIDLGLTVSSSFQCRSYKLTILKHDLINDGFPLNVVINKNPIIVESCEFC